MNELHRLILAALIVDGLAGCEIAFIDEAGQIIKLADMAPGKSDAALCKCFGPRRDGTRSRPVDRVRHSRWLVDRWATSGHLALNVPKGEQSWLELELELELELVVVVEAGQAAVGLAPVRP